jgi:hypothetical protein
MWSPPRQNLMIVFCNVQVTVEQESPSQSSTTLLTAVSLANALGMQLSSLTGGQGGAGGGVGGGGSTNATTSSSSGTPQQQQGQQGQQGTASNLTAAQMMMVSMGSMCICNVWYRVIMHNWRPSPFHFIHILLAVAYQPLFLQANCWLPEGCLTLLRVCQMMRRGHTPYIYIHIHNTHAQTNKQTDANANTLVKYNA